MKRLIYILCFILSHSAYSNTVNILTWWDFINEPKALDHIEKTCGVKLSIDEYYSDIEFLRRFNRNIDQYDLIIFSDVMLAAIANHLATRQINISEIAQHYLPAIYQAYKQAAYPTNVLYFSHYIKVILWNPKRINLSKEDDIQSVLKKANNNLMIFINDPFELYEITNIYHQQKNNFDFSHTLEKMGEKYHIRFSNEISNLYNSNNFSFAITWSSTGMSIVKRINDNYQLLSLPELSFMASDLIAVLNKKASSLCVMKELSSEKVIRMIQANNPFLSPYDGYHSITSEKNKEFYQQSLGNMNHLKWKVIPSEPTFWSIYDQWSKFKIDYEYK